MNSLDQLVQAAQSGQREAFARLVERYQRVVIATAAAILRDFHTAQDVAQDSFVLAFEKLGSLRTTATFGAWLLAIVRREALRVSQRTAFLPDSLDTASDIESVAGPPWCAAHDELWKSIGSLSDHEREVIVFYYFDGYTSGEIAELTGRSTGTITKQLSRAIERLRRTLKQVPQ